MLLRRAAYLPKFFLNNPRQVLLCNLEHCFSDHIAVFSANLFSKRCMLFVKPAVFQTRLTRPEHQLIENGRQQMLLPVSCKEIQIRSGDRDAVPLPRHGLNNFKHLIVHSETSLCSRKNSLNPTQPIAPQALR